MKKSTLPLIFGLALATNSAFAVTYDNRITNNITPLANSSPPIFNYYSIAQGGIMNSNANINYGESRSPGTSYATPPVSHLVGISYFTITDRHGAYGYSCIYHTPPAKPLSNDLYTNQLVLKGTCTSKKLSD